jgi:hypothetical protein
LIRARQGQEGSSSFLKKRTKKLLLISRRAEFEWRRGTQQTKVFWFFFSKKNCFLCLLLAGVLPAAPAVAEVRAASPAGFIVHESQKVQAAPGRAYESLRDVGRWWSSDHTYSHNALNLSLQLRPGGCLCEILPLGGGVEHLRVVYVEPGRRVVLHGALGPLQPLGASGALTFTFAPADTHNPKSGTIITLDYAVGGYFGNSTTDWPRIVDHVLAEQLRRLARYADTGRADEPAPPPAGPLH